MLDLDYINYVYLIPRVIHRLCKAIYRLYLGYISYMQTTPKLCTVIIKLCMDIPKLCTDIFGLCRLYIGLYLSYIGYT
jgi:hypothetical protein